MTDKPTIYQLLTLVMSDVQAVGKDGFNEQQRYKFRGIDATVNAVGPALRKHGVIVVPELLDASWRDVQTVRGNPARECTVKVKYTFYSPYGEKLEVTVPGESLDSGDKGAAKAMSVAFRTALLQALCIPTDDPDPDSHSYERAAQAVPVSDEAAESARASAINSINATTKLHILINDIFPRLKEDALAGRYGDVQEATQVKDVYDARIKALEA